VIERTGIDDYRGKQKETRMAGEGGLGKSRWAVRGSRRDKFGGGFSQPLRGRAQQDFSQKPLIKRT